MMYFSGELNTGGIVERLSFYRKMGTSMTQRKLKIWMSTYDGYSLDAYIPPSQQQLVFDGRIDFNEGLGWVNINLDQPFVYAGNGNLVVTVYYYDGSSYASNAHIPILTVVHHALFLKVDGQPLISRIHLMLALHIAIHIQHFYLKLVWDLEILREGYCIKQTILL